MDDKENRNMLVSLSGQHQQLLHLQECQKMLLNTQREFSKLGLTAQEEMGKKYDILQSVKHKITQLENMAMSPDENKIAPASKSNTGIDSEDSMVTMKGNLSDLHGLVSTLLSEVDEMIDQNESLPETFHNEELGSMNDLSALSPLPQVELVDRQINQHVDLSGSYNHDMFGSVERHITTPIKTVSSKSPDISWDLGDFDEEPTNSKALFNDSTPSLFLSETEKSDHYNYTALDDMLGELNNAIIVLRSLLVDQRSLRSLLRNSMNRDSDSLGCAYGISPDFIKYQLDSCTQQVAVFQNHVGLLQKQFADLKLSADPLLSPRNDSKLPNMKGGINLNETTDTELLETFANDDKCFLYPVYMYSIVSNTDVRKAFPSSDAEMPLLQIKKLFYECQNPEDQTYLDTISEKNLEDVLNSVGITLSSYLDFICESESKMSYKTLMNTFPFLKNRFVKAQTTEKKECEPSFFDDIITEGDSPWKCDPGFEEGSPQKCDPLFESLREDIYSQAAVLIFQNEDRPHFLLELFHELKQLDSDYLRQQCLHVLRDSTRGYLQNMDVSTSNLNSGHHSLKLQSYLEENSELFTENTPSECDASDLDDSDDEIVNQRNHPHLLSCDFALDVSNGTDFSTPVELSSVANEEEEIPFETDYLGSTVLHLDKALQRVREIEKAQQDKIDAPLLLGMQDVACVDQEKIKKERVSSKKNMAFRSEKNNIKFLETFVKRIMSKMVTVHILNSPEFHLSEENAQGMVKSLLTLISQERMMDYIDYIHLKTSKFKDASMFHKISQYFMKELSSEIEKCLNEEFVGQSFTECGEKIVVRLADILYRQFSFYCLEGDTKKIHFKNFSTVENVLAENVNESFQEKLVQGYFRDEEEERMPEDLSEQEEEDNGSTMGEFSSETVIVVIDSNEEVKSFEENGGDGNKNDRDEESVDGDEENGKSLVVDLSASETKPLTSYGSGEDEEAGSGDDFVYNEVEVSTSMQQDQNAVGDAGGPIKNEVKCN